MRIIPVLDVRGGQVVHAIGGRREEYRPITTDLCSSVTPLEVANAIRDRAGCEELYIADLSGIAGAHPSWPIIWKLRESGFRLWLDAGASSIGVAPAVGDADALEGLTVIIASEWLQSEHRLPAAIRRFGADRTAFSLDLRGGQVRSRIAAWKKRTPEQLFQRACELGAAKFIVLDVATIGDSSGCQTLDLCRQLRQMSADVELISGGGIRTLEHLRDAHEAGCDGVLVATALHTGEVSREDIKEASSWSRVRQA